MESVVGVIGFIITIMFFIAYLGDIIITVIKVMYRVITVKNYDITNDKDATLFRNNFNKKQ